MTTVTDGGRRADRGTPPRRRGVLLGAGLLGLALVIAGGAYLWLAATAEVRRTGTSCAEVPITGAARAGTDPRAGICATLDGLVEAWNRGDATAYGARFTEDASYVAFTGTVHEGREDITSAHAALFAGLLEGSRLHASYLGIDVVAPGVARVLARGDTVEGDAAPGAPSKVQTYLMVEQEGTWKVAAFHNTQRSPVMERIQFLLEPGSKPWRER